MNAADPKGAQLRRTLEHLTLEKMIERIKNEDPDLGQLCNVLHKCCQFKKADAAEEKNRPTDRFANQPTPPENEQSHDEFCRTLTDAAMDIWGIDISHMHKSKNQNAQSKNQPDPSNPEPLPAIPSDPEHPHANPPLQLPTAPLPGLPFGGPSHHPDALSETQSLYDIPPKYRQGATPIKDSQQKHGQPKYTHDEWRKAMHRAIRENYGIYDDDESTSPPHDESTSPPTTNPPHPPTMKPPHPPSSPTSPKRQRGPPRATIRKTPHATACRFAPPQKTNPHPILANPAPRACRFAPPKKTNPHPILANPAPRACLLAHFDILAF